VGTMLDDYKEESIMDEHILLDLVANSQIVLKGVQYGIFAQDIDVLKKAVLDLKDVVDVMSEVIDDDFGE
jgi:hypothetical protein